MATKKFETCLLLIVSISYNRGTMLTNGDEVADQSPIMPLTKCLPQLTAIHNRWSFIGISSVDSERHVRYISYRHAYRLRGRTVVLRLRWVIHAWPRHRIPWDGLSLDGGEALNRDNRRTKSYWDRLESFVGHGG